MPSSDPTPSEFVRIEAHALLALAARLDGPQSANFALAIDTLAACTAAQARILLTGIGKSGIIARKIAATLRSTGTPAHFLHPAEAIHGDLGMLTPNDVVLALSYSGETAELLQLLPTFERLQTRLITLCGCPGSTLAKASHIVLDSSIDAEACTHNLAPTASTTVMLALGDALALSLARRNGFEAQHFADLHPGGKLGHRLTRVRDLMHTGDALPHVSTATPMARVIYEMSSKKLGMTIVLDGPHLAGMISDGDLRRLLERDGPNALNHTAGDIMNATPQTIAPEAFATTALTLMEEKKITSLIVTSPDDPTVPEGVLHLHDVLARNLL